MRNAEFTALINNMKIVKVYVPYYFKDMVNTYGSRLNYYDLVINRLKLFYKITKNEKFIGLFWDPTTTGIAYITKTQENA